MIERVPIVPGLAMPFFPARPRGCLPLVSGTQAVTQLCADLDAGYVVSPKLNGDRACVGVVASEDSLVVYVQNRHGAWLTQKAKNVAAFLALGAGSCADCEIIDGMLYPFEMLAWGGASLVGLPSVERARAAELACHYMDVPFLFSTPSLNFVRRFRANMPRWEGWVRKANLPYPLGSTATTETDRYSRVKWAT